MYYQNATALLKKKNHVTPLKTGDPAFVIWHKIYTAYTISSLEHTYCTSCSGYYAN